MKRKYSLTAKERKERNKAKSEEIVEKPNRDKQIEQENSNEPVSFDDGDTASVSQEAAGQAVVAKKKNTLMIVMAVFMIVLLLTGIVVTIMLIDEINKPQGNPIATITLDTGDKLEFVLYEDTAPNAVTNFMFLSMRGFFDGTVFHDNQNNWLRFMGMTDYNTHRSEDDEYCKNFKGFDKYDYEWGQSLASPKNIFWYRVKNDSTAINFDKEKNNEGLLCFQYSSSSCLYQISAVNNPNTRIHTTDRKTFVVMGRYSNAKTLEIIKKLDLGQENGTLKRPWYNPNTVITIKNIKISNYDRDKWEGEKGILNNFDSYMEEIGAHNSHQSNYNSILS